MPLRFDPRGFSHVRGLLWAEGAGQRLPSQEVHGVITAARLIELFNPVLRTQCIDPPLGDPMTGHRDAVVAFSPDGGRIVSGGSDSTVRVWPMTLSWPVPVCAKVIQNMSRHQGREWVSPDIGYIKVCLGLPISTDDEAG